MKDRRLAQEAREWRTLQREVAAGIVRLEQSLAMERMELLVRKRDIPSLQGVGAADVQDTQSMKPSTAYGKVKLPRLDVMDQDVTPCKWLEKISEPRPEERVIEAPKPTRHQDVVRWFEIMSEIEKRDRGTNVDLGRCLRDS